jgi:hypothetical protein
VAAAAMVGGGWWRHSDRRVLREPLGRRARVECVPLREKELEL